MAQLTKPQALKELFSDMPDTARVWIYQSERPLNEKEEKMLRTEIDSFVKSWSAHGNKLKADYAFLYSTFLILMVDEDQANASGCSIDDSVHTIQSLEKLLGISFMNRMVVTYRDGDELRHVSMNDFWALIKSGRVTSETTVYNNLVKNKAELESSWEVPLEKSWHKQMFD
ncbi:ABC transporter ATPase [Halocola ammonii]